MKYLFNHSVLFDTALYQLYLVDNKASAIRLSNTAGRVLEELARSHGLGQTVGREQLFESVWVRHGLSPSNGNLNQQISLIRKALVSLGLEAGVIVTLPKRGLKLNDHLLVEPIEETLPPAPAAPQSPIAESPEPAPGKAWTKTAFINTGLIIAVIACSLAAYFYLNAKDKQPLFFFEKLNTCEVYTFKPVSERERAPMLLQLRQTMTGNIENCGDHNILLFSHNVITNTTARSGLHQRIFMAKCDKDTRGNISGCLNFYFYNWDE